MPDFTDLIGKPFEDNDTANCWATAKEVFRRFGTDNLPDYRIGCEEASLINAAIDEQRERWIKCDPNNPPVPSLIVIRYGSQWCNHTGVYLGNGQFIHTREKVGVNIDRIDAISWKRKIEGFYVPRG